MRRPLITRTSVVAPFIDYEVGVASGGGRSLLCTRFPGVGVVVDPVEPVFLTAVKLVVYFVRFYIFINYNLIITPDHDNTIFMLPQPR